MEALRIIVQASSKAWGGGGDLCMEIVDGSPVICHTLNQIIKTFPDALVTIAAPSFDRGGELDNLLRKFNNPRLAIYYGHDASPLSRMVEITNGLKDDDYIIRTDGLNFCVDLDASKKMLKVARKKSLDCIKLPDDFPVIFTSDIYRVGALRQLEKLLTEDSQNIFRVHPKYFMFSNKNIFNTAYFQETSAYQDNYLYDCRKIATQIYNRPRGDVNSEKINAGDLLTYHYDIATKYISTNDIVLDIASGTGHGSALTASKMPTASVTAADYDPLTIKEGESRFRDIKNLSFSVQDVTDMTFQDNSFDAVLSMETIEHIEDANRYCREINRVLRPNGIFVISTPQNSIGHIPINAQHIREYSFSQLLYILQEYFLIKEAIGIKQGCVWFPDDPIGTNTMVVCEKK